MSSRFGRLLLVMAIAVATLAAPVRAAAQELPEFTGNEFADLFNTARLENLAPIGPAPSITGNPSIDQRIRDIGEGRGYIRRPLPDGPLTWVSGNQLQPSAVDAWIALRDAAKAAGYTMVLESGYRSHAAQASVLLSRLYSYSDAAIDARLRYVAVPGYSKHHTGYAIDITQAGYSFSTFRYSPLYRWLVADNYANAKRFGWVPSYPPDADSQGPLPETWEFTYVGMDNIHCYGFESSVEDRFCDDDRSVFEADIEWLADQGITNGCNLPAGDRFCPSEPITRAQFAAFLHRALGDSIPAPQDPVAFADTVDSVFAGDIAWLSATGITLGCGADTFCPEDPVTRGQLAAFFVRAFGYVDGFAADLFIDDDHSIFAGHIDALATEGVTRGCNPPVNDQFCPEDVVTRGQMAAFLHRAMG